MKTLSWLAIAFSYLPVQAQPAATRQRIETLFNEPATKPQVLLLGTFHFAGEQVDASTTPGSLSVDMLAPARQEQIKALVNQLARFRPTKIAIEAAPRQKKYIDSLYSAYCKGTFKGSSRLNAADEIVQIGFRLARMLGHTELFPVDAQPFRIQFSRADSLTMFSKYEDQTDSSFAYWDKRYETYALLQDSLKYGSSLKEFLLFLNSDKTQARSIGRWLVQTKKGSSQEPIGADKFIARYYNRNIRIYSNVQRMVTSPADRIVVIYGNTHQYILKHLFEASPEFEVVPVTDYLK